MKNLDQKVKIGFLLVAILFMALFGIKKTRSFFTDKEVSTGNVLSVATDWGGSPTPEITVTPTPEGPTQTPTPILVLTATPTPEETKINICHNKGTGANPWQAMNIAQSAWPGHQGHGDFLYTGPVDTNNKPTNEGDSWCINNLPTPTQTPTLTQTPTPTTTLTPTPTSGITP